MPDTSSPHPPLSSWEVMTRLAHHLRPYRGRVVLTIALSFAISVLFAGSLAFLQPLIELLINPDGLANIRRSPWLQGPWGEALAGWIAPFIADQRTALFSFAGLLFGMGLVKNVLRFWQEYLAGWIGERLTADLTGALYERTQALEPGYFVRAGIQQTVSRFAVDIPLVGAGLVKLLDRAIREPLKALGALVVMLLIAPELTLVAVVVFPLAGAAIVWFGKSIKRRTRRILARRAVLQEELAENIHGIRIVQVQELEPHFAAKVRRRSEELFGDARKVVLLDAITSPAMEVMIHAIGAAVVLYTGLLVLDGKMTSSHFFVFYAATAAMFDPVSKLSGLNNKLQAALASGGRVFELMDAVPDVVEPAHPRPLPRFEHHIAFEGVSFDYPARTGQGRPTVLKDVSLEIAKGEMIGIVGPTGAGKSTLAYLLPRFADPTSGTIRIDGTDLREARLTDLRSQIALVTQEHLLWNDTIGANIRLGRLDASAADIEAAARAAHIHDFIVAQPKGYDTMIGEIGSTLSGGQRQRLALARAILKNPRILILDEATNALDATSEYEVQAALDEFAVGRTTIVIAHRLSTVRKANRIVVLNAGRVEAVGPHAELLATSATYRDFVDKQSAAAPPA